MPFSLAYDLPQRPNEAQIFFRNMSKVVLLLLGSVETSDSGESDVNELQQPFMQQSTESGRYLAHLRLQPSWQNTLINTEHMYMCTSISVYYENAMK